MADYVSVAELRTHLGISDSADDSTLTMAIDAAERAVDAWCGRRFVLAATATARLFRATDPYLLRLERSPIGTTTGLIVKTDDTDNGTFGTTIASTSYQLEPFDGLGPDGRTDWPYDAIRRLDGEWPTSLHGRPLVQITAKWGWAAAPEPVQYATLLLAAETWKQKDATFGIAAFGEFGSIRVRDNPKIESLLAPYRTGIAIVGMA